MSYWPPGLPEPMLGGSFTTAENRLMTEGDIAPRQRIIDANYRQGFTASWVFSEEEYRVFEAWYHWTVYDGISWFDVTWQNRAGRAQFNGNVQASLKDVNWQVNGEVLIDYAVP